MVLTIRLVLCDAKPQVVWTCTFVVFNFFQVSSPVIRLAFHNLLELKHVRLTDLHLLRDDVFSYDELDGRPGPQRFMLSKLRTLSVANCSKLSSVAVKHLAARATELESLDLSGCDDVDDKAIGFLTVDSERQTPRNRSLQVLRMNFCGKLTDATLRGVADALPDLQVSCSPKFCARLFSLKLVRCC